MRIVQLMTDRSRYFNPSKNYWFSFNAFLISLIGLFIYGFADNFRFCLSINKNGRIICFQWMNQTAKRKAPSGRAVLTRTTRNDKHRKYRPILSLNCCRIIVNSIFLSDYKNLKSNFFWATVMRIVQLMTDRSRYFNPSKNYWFSLTSWVCLLIHI
jgi:hypothetical protein